jgi:hypothetical protein
MAAVVVLSLLLLLPPLLKGLVVVRLNHVDKSTAKQRRQEPCQTASAASSTLRTKELFTTLAVQHKLLRCFNYQTQNQPIVAFAGCRGPSLCTHQEQKKKSLGTTEAMPEGAQGDSMAKHRAESFWDRRQIRGKGPHNGHVKALSPLPTNRLLQGTS